jgi:hypothetical protein
MTKGRPIKTSNEREFGGPIARRAKHNGYDLNWPMNTLDGDEVDVLAVTPGHPYPIVGEVRDHNSNTAWLARWNEAGQYRGTLEAASKHSFERNTDPVMSLTYRRHGKSVLPFVVMWGPDDQPDEVFGLDDLGIVILAGTDLENAEVARAVRFGHHDPKPGRSE